MGIAWHSRMPVDIQKGDGLAKTCVIWRITDGKRGHERQTEGLACALARLGPVRVIDVPRLPTITAVLQYLIGRFSPGKTLEAPDLILGAGHGTHLSVLAARRARGGHAVVLMKPSLPMRWFDVCLIPEHDEIAASANVLLTRGALNPIQPGVKQENAGLIMVGGPSGHFEWNDERILAQIRGVLERESSVDWVLTTSPRTPAGFLTKLQALHGDQMEIVPYAMAGTGWLPEKLAAAARAWVTPDSVSMIYEALTSGASVGVFDLKQVRSSRVARGLALLLREGLIVCYADWQRGVAMPLHQETFNEAARCARWIKQHWLPEN